MEWLENLVNNLVTWVTSTGIKVVIALIVLLVSFKLISWVCKKIMAKSEGTKIDKTIIKTLVYAGSLLARCIVIVCLVGFLGVDTSAITALIASFGVCIGLAVNGAVSNFAGGVLLLVTRPFKVDDFIEAQGISGVVADIHITNTKIITGDQKVVYVPNGALSNGTIINYSEKENRRVDIDFTIAYSADSEKAKQIIMDLMAAHELILKDPAPFVRMSAHGSSSIVIKTRAWAKNSDYWSVYFDLMEQVKSAFDQNGIEIPFDQLDVHIKKD